MGQMITWKVTGGSQILINHLDPNSSNGGRHVDDKIQSAKATDSKL
jgi:hypothetical protein